MTTIAERDIAVLLSQQAAGSWTTAIRVSWSWLNNEVVSDLRPRKAVGSSVLTLKDLYLDVSVKVLDVAQDPVDGLFEFGFSPYEWHGGQEVQKREGVVSVDIVSSIIPSV
jgi:hypothetical protein